MFARVVLPMFKPIPQAAYNRAKRWLLAHHWMHYLAHSTYCKAKDNINGGYRGYSPREWISKFR